MPLISPPAKLPWLTLEAFNENEVARDSLHFGADFPLLVSFLESKPYLNKETTAQLPLDPHDTILFLLGLAIGFINIEIGQFSEPGKTKWDESILDLKSAQNLVLCCSQFCKDFDFLQEQAAQNHAKAV